MFARLSKKRRTRRLAALFGAVAMLSAAVTGCTITRGDEGFETRIGSNRNYCPWHYGGRGDDRQAGGGCDDHLFGGAGDDEQRGGSGDDILIGGAGADIQRGGEGADVLIGGPGRDVQYGEEGDDVILAGGDDGVVDGGPGTDTLLLDGEAWRFEPETSEWVHDESGARIKTTGIELVRDAAGHEYTVPRP